MENWVLLISTATKDPSLRLTATRPGTVGFHAQSLTVIPSVDESLTSWNGLHSPV